MSWQGLPPPGPSPGPYGRQEKEGEIMGNNVLSQLLEELNSGSLKVVDLTTPLGPETVVIDLPAKFRAMIVAGQPGTGTSCTWASTQVRISTRRSTGSPVKTCQTTPPIPSRRASSSAP